MNKVTIPRCAHPFVVTVNGRKYIYPAGTEQEVPDAVAAIIEQHNESHNDYGCGAAEKTEFAIGYGEGYAVGCAAGSAPFKNFIEGKLPEIIIPEITTIGEHTFYFNPHIKKIDAPNVLVINESAFADSAIEFINFPKVKRIYDSAFSDSALRGHVDFPCLEFLYSYALCYTSVNALILRNTSVVCVLDDEDALFETPIENGNGYIYVPRALLNSYKEATNWSVYADQFRALEDYTVDGTTTGALDESKI